jgi:serine/threonine protein kinase
MKTCHFCGYINALEDPSCIRCAHTFDVSHYQDPITHPGRSNGRAQPQTWQDPGLPSKPITPQTESIAWTCDGCFTLNPPDKGQCERCGHVQVSCDQQPPTQHGVLRTHVPPKIDNTVARPNELARVEFTTGRVIDGKYQLEELLGKGGMGIVWSAKQFGIDRQVAVKVLHPHLLSRPEWRVRMLREARALARVSHRNVVKIIDCIDTPSTVALVLEYIKDGSLADVIERDGAIPLLVATQWMQQILSGLSAIHRNGLVHRDIKPDNILMEVDMEWITPKVSDLGIAFDQSTEPLTREGVQVGTYEYMSPEQVRGQKVGVLTDIYAAGIVFYELLVGDVPFSGSDFQIQQDHVEKLPDWSLLPADGAPQLVGILERALCKQTNGRFQSAQDFSHALDSLV